MLSTVLVYIVGIYLLIGFVFALFFVTKGMARLDPVAQAGSKGFRLLILPGVTALWPILYRRWSRGQQAPPTGVNEHMKLVAFSQQNFEELE